MLARGFAGTFRATARVWALLKIVIFELAEFPTKLSRISKGEAIAVDLSTLIEKIVASPGYPGWAMASLQKRVTSAGLKVQVETSDLLKLPEADKIPYVGRRAD